MFSKPCSKLSGRVDPDGIGHLFGKVHSYSVDVLKHSSVTFVSFRHLLEWVQVWTSMTQTAFPRRR